MRTTAPLVSALSALLALPSASAAIQFGFTFSDAPGTGFNDTGALGVERRGALSAAASSLAASFVGYDVNLAITVSSENVNNTTLGSARSFFAGGENGFRQSVAEVRIQNGTDGNGADADAEIKFNFHQAWDYDDTVGSGTFDFKATALHELTHVLGFGSLLTATGQGGRLNPSGQPDIWRVFDQFITDGAGNRMVTADFRYDTARTLAPLTGNPGLFFSGPNAMAAYGGQRVPLYSPSPWVAGSSASHTDDTTFDGVDRLVMNATTGTGPGLRELGAVELGILQDIGYATVPEAGTLACWSGVGLLLFAGWRRHRGGGPA